MYVGRIVSNDVVLLGHYITGVFWSVREGYQFGPVFAEDQVIEFLLKDPVCPVLWMPFTAGEPLPFGAAIGGRLTTRSATYVTQVIQNGLAVFGYYDPESDLEYHAFHGPNTASAMDLLVLLWESVMSWQTLTEKVPYIYIVVSRCCLVAIAVWLCVAWCSFKSNRIKSTPSITNNLKHNVQWNVYSSSSRVLKCFVYKRYSREWG